MSPRPIILLDVDGVLADFVGGICKLLGEYGYKRRPEHFFDLDMAKVLTPEESAVIEQHAHREGFCSSLEWYPGAKTMVECLKDLGDVYACTAHWRASSWCGERMAWLEPLIDRKQVIFTHAKSLIRGDVIIEDSVAHAEASRCKHAIVVDRPWNQKQPSARDDDPRLYEPFERIGNYVHLVNYVKGALDGW